VSAAAPAPEASQGALVARELTKSYRGRVVVDGVGLAVGAGEVVGLLGPNGAGKTTTFKLILGLERQERGAVELGGRALDGLPLHRRARRGLGYLPQGPSVFQGLAVRDNLLVLLETLGRPEPRHRAAELLEQFGLTARADQRASTLSGGERRRLEFARALCSAPRILLTDEPFAGVDPLAVAGITAAIRELRGAGVGVLLTDHSVRQALEICDRIYLIVEGKIVEEGTPGQLRDSATARRLYLGEGFGD
jgi:lipopolysaccharide export system ATP-binding protein